MKSLISAGVLAATLLAPAAAFAQTYYYVNADGEMKTVDADNSSDAVNNATGIAANTSVFLDGDTLSRQIYQYVSGLGAIKVVVAATADAALATAADIALHSGVINVDVAGNPITTDITVSNANAGAL
jgi:hypothetical protein